MRNHREDPMPVNTKSLLAGLGVVAAFALVIGVVVAMDLLAGGRATYDQDLYHAMAVRQFAAQWPNFDLVNYRSATTPGYHLVLAAVARFVSADLAVLRLGGSLFTIGLLATLAVALARRSGPMMTAALLLPVGASVYVFGPAVFLLPDNAAWWAVLGVMLIALDRRVNLRTLTITGVLLVLLVWARQIHVWAAGVVWFAAWMGESGSLWLARAAPSESDRSTLRPRLARASVALVFTLPAFLMLAYFVRSWGGLVPPLFQGEVFDPVVGENAPNSTGGNFATPAFVLTLVGLFGVFFLGSFYLAIARLIARERGVVVAVAIGAGVGLVLAVVPQTFWSIEQGRYSGFWTIARKFPDIAGRSVFITGGSVVGGAMLGLVWSALTRREAWVLVVSLLGFTAAQTATFFAWQRYLEPMVLLVLVLAASRAVWDQESRAPKLVGAARMAGPMVLAVILAGITYTELRRPSTISADQKSISVQGSNASLP